MQWPELLNQEYEQTVIEEMLKENPFQLFILGAIFAPIIEEMMFRTLIKPSHNDLLFLLCSWPIFYANFYIPNDLHWLIKLAFISILMLSLFYTLKRIIPTHKTNKLRIFLSNYYLIILILSSLIFGLVHINNYVDTFILDITLITLIIPRILSGFMMGLLKVKNKNIYWSMGLHTLNNSVVLLIMISAQSISS